MARASRRDSVLRHLGPAVGFMGWREALRATLCLGGAIALVELAFRPMAAANAASGLFLIAPFGASAVLLFALPNSPLAQPWSALMGNGISAAAAVVTVKLVRDPLLGAGLAAGLAMLCMHLARALHPPGGAVALTAVLNPDMIHDLGFWFVLAPVVLGTAGLILLAVPFARATGRHYPFRQPAETNAVGTADPAPPDRLGVSRAELADLLHRFRQEANIGVEDLARLIGAAERLVAQHHTDGVPCAEIMSRDLVTVGPDTPLIEVAEIIRAHRFTSVPVIGPDQTYLGVIFQIHLIRRGQDEARRSGGRFQTALARVLRRDAGRPLRALDVMDAKVPHVTPDQPVSAVLPVLADSACDAVPVLEGARIVGIITRTDLIAALARLQVGPVPAI